MAVCQELITIVPGRSSSDIDRQAASVCTMQKFGEKIAGKSLRELGETFQTGEFMRFFTAANEQMEGLSMEECASFLDDR